MSFSDALIRNFQAHDRLVLDFAPGVTAIVGPTDAGKSAVIRSLFWLVCNRPGGISFIRHGAESCFVILRDAVHSVKRTKGGMGNTYALDGRELKAFGSDVPPDVAKALALSELNFQFQHDAPFWFSLSPPEASRRLNEIVDLGSIDQAGSFCASRLRSAKSDLELAQQALQEAKAGIESLGWVQDMDKDLREIEHLEREEDNLLCEFLELDRLASSVYNHEQAGKVELPDFTEIEKLRKAEMLLEERMAGLRHAISLLGEQEAIIEILSDKIETRTEQMRKEFPEGYCPLCHQKIPKS